MANKVLLDTSILLALFARDVTIRKHLLAVPETFIPGVVLGELFLGAYRTPQPETVLMKLSNFASVAAVLPCDTNTALAYSQVKSSLHAKKTFLPENDAWIAALAIQHDLTLVSRDARFRKVERLRFEMW